MWEYKQDGTALSELMSFNYSLIFFNLRLIFINY